MGPTGVSVTLYARRALLMGGMSDNEQAQPRRHACASGAPPHEDVGDIAGSEARPMATRVAAPLGRHAARLQQLRLRSASGRGAAKTFASSEVIGCSPVVAGPHGAGIAGAVAAQQSLAAMSRFKHHPSAVAGPLLTTLNAVAAADEFDPSPTKGDRSAPGATSTSDDECTGCEGLADDECYVTLKDRIRALLPCADLVVAQQASLMRMGESIVQKDQQAKRDGQALASTIMNMARELRGTQAELADKERNLAEAMKVSLEREERLDEAEAELENLTATWEEAAIEAEAANDDLKSTVDRLRSEAAARAEAQRRSAQALVAETGRAEKAEADAAGLEARLSSALREIDELERDVDTLKHASSQVKEMLDADEGGARTAILGGASECASPDGHGGPHETLASPLRLAEAAMIGSRLHAEEVDSTTDEDSASAKAARCRDAFMDCVDHWGTVVFELEQAARGIARELTAMTGERDGACDTIRVLESRVRRLERDVEAGAGELAASARLCDAANQRAAEAEARATTLEAESSRAVAFAQAQAEAFRERCERAEGVSAKASERVEATGQALALLIDCVRELPAAGWSAEIEEALARARADADHADDVLADLCTSARGEVMRVAAELAESRQLSREADESWREVVGALERRIDELSKELREALTRNAAAAAECDAATKDVERACTSMEAIETKNANIITAYAEAEADARTRESEQVSALEARVRVLQDQADVQIEELATAHEATAKAAHEATQTVDRALAEARAVAEAAAAKITKLRKKRDDAVARANQATERGVELQRQVKALEDAVASAVRDRDVATTQCAAAEARAEQARTELRDEHDEVREALAAAVETVAATEQHNERLSERLEAIHAERDRALSDLREARTEVRETKEALALAESGRLAADSEPGAESLGALMEAEMRVRVEMEQESAEAEAKLRHDFENTLAKRAKANEDLQAALSALALEMKEAQDKAHACCADANAKAASLQTLQAAARHAVAMARSVTPEAGRLDDTAREDEQLEVALVDTVEEAVQMLRTWQGALDGDLSLQGLGLKPHLRTANPNDRNEGSALSLARVAEPERHSMPLETVGGQSLPELFNSVDGSTSTSPPSSSSPADASLSSDAAAPHSGSSPGGDSIDAHLARLRASYASSEGKSADDIVRVLASITKVSGDYLFSIGSKRCTLAVIDGHLSIREGGSGVGYLNFESWLRSQAPNEAAKLDPLRELNDARRV